MKINLNQLAARLFLLIPFMSYLTNGYGWGGKCIKRWYASNNIFRFKPGDEIELKGTAFGYGLRPQGVIVVCNNNYYVVDVTSDNAGDWHRLINDGYVPDNVTRSTKRQTHFKWNIENHFKSLTSRIPSLNLVNA